MNQKTRKKIVDADPTSYLYLQKYMPNKGLTALK